MQSRNAFFGTSIIKIKGHFYLNLTPHVAFAGIVTAVSAWSIWGGEMFPAEKDPVGGKNARQPLHDSPSIKTIARSIEMDRFRA